MCKQKTGTNATAYDLIMQSFIVKLEKDKYFLFQTDTGCSMGTVKNKDDYMNISFCHWHSASSLKRSQRLAILIYKSQKFRQVP